MLHSSTSEYFEDWLAIRCI